MRYFKANTFSCFSPPVMIATFIIEIVLACYILWRYSFNNVTRIAAAILILLAVFQLAEYNICEGSFGLDSLEWSRVGYIAITMLPPLGLHLAMQLAGDKRRAVLAAAYGSAIAFAVFFLVSARGVSASACMGNYVIFTSTPQAVLYYAAYYFGWVLVGTWYSHYTAAKLRPVSKSYALRALGVGYLILIIPTIIFTLIDREALGSIPSIMCGFAVFLAIIIARIVVPQYFADHTPVKRKLDAKRH